ncbi:flavodoxin family protein [Kitasatospora sp. Ki12]
MMKKVVERLYACSSILDSEGQYALYGRVGGCSRHPVRVATVTKGASGPQALRRGGRSGEGSSVSACGIRREPKV